MIEIAVNSFFCSYLMVGHISLPFFVRPSVHQVTENLIAAMAPEVKHRKFTQILIGMKCCASVVYVLCQTSKI